MSFQFIDIASYNYPNAVGTKKAKVLFDLVTSNFYLQDYYGNYIPILGGGGGGGATGPTGETTLYYCEEQC